MFVKRMAFLERLHCVPRAVRQLSTLGECPRGPGRGPVGSFGEMSPWLAIAFRSACDSEGSLGSAREQGEATVRPGIQEACPQAVRKCLGVSDAKR